MAYHYDKVLEILSKPSSRRWNDEIQGLEPWFKKRSSLFQGVNTSVVLDVIKHCDLVTVRKGSVVVHQGDKGDDFFIILRGRVSVLIRETHKEDEEDVFKLPEDKCVKDKDRSKLGCLVGVLGDGKTFGEQALINDDCVRTATVVADDVTDLISIQRDLYNRSLAKVVHHEFEEKLTFIGQNPIFRLWSNKWKKTLAVALNRELKSYEETLVKQGDKADCLYFIIDGEVKVSVEPEEHKEQFANFMHKCSLLFDDEEKAGITCEYFTLAKWVSPKSRAADRLKNMPGSGPADDYVASVDLPEFKVNLSPSDVRKQSAQAKTNCPKINVCYLESGHMFGDLEFLVPLRTYHASAVCTLQTTVFSVHRVVFDRLFRKKNPLTLDVMRRGLGTAVRRRHERAGLMEAVPLLRYLNMKVEYLNGERKARRRVKEDDCTVSLMDDLASRPKSRVSNKSFPLSRKSARRRGLGGGDGHLPAVGGGCNDHSGSIAEARPMDRHEKALKFTLSLPPAGTSGTSGSGAKKNPMEGIFLKLMAVSSPMVTRRELGMDAEEYAYLLQLKRRLSKQMEDFMPAFANLQSNPARGTNPQSAPSPTHPRDNFPALRGQRQGGNTPRKASLKSPRKPQQQQQGGESKKKKAGRRKSVLFALPHF